MRTRKTGSALLLPLVAVTLAVGLAGCDRGGKPKGHGDARKETDCVYSDKLFSNGAVACVANKRALTCDKGKWQEADPQKFPAEVCSLEAATPR